MSRRSLPVRWIFAMAIVVGVAACGGGGDEAFKDCGNGVLDGFEQCDDGNLEEGDACLSTCELNVCGDGFVNVGVEQCDLVAKGDCTQLGFAAGTVACSIDCTIDTSGCSGTPHPTPTPEVTPSGGVETPTPTATPEGPASPTVTATPGGDNICQSGQAVRVTAALDKAYAGFTTTLAYPASVLIPGSASSVGSRVVFDVTGGFSTVSDDDDIGGDGVDDTLHASFAGSVDNAPGAVFTVTFDCLAGQAKPAASEFTCLASASTPAGDPVADEVCSLVVQ